MKRIGAGGLTPILAILAIIGVGVIVFVITALT